MLRKIKINPKARIAHIPKELIEQGFKGDLDGYANAVTLTLVNPKTPLKDVERSLKIVLDDVKFRRQMEETGEHFNEGIPVAEPTPNKGAGRQLTKAHGGTGKNAKSGS